MWFQKTVFDKFNKVLRLGSLKEADRILVGVLQEESKIPDPPNSCPHCRKDLVRQALPYLELFVSACPEKHGFWMTPENSSGLKKFLREQISEETQKNHKLRLVRSFFIGFAAVLALHLSLPALENLKTLNQNRLNRLENEKIGFDYWPARERSYFPEIPVKESAIDRADELFYLKRWSEIMNENISNRMNMAGILQTRRGPEDYTALLAFYLRKQTRVLEELEVLDVPERLKNFHQHMLDALKSQMRFYASFAMEKAKDPSASLEAMLQHPDLIVSSRELHDAQALILGLYEDIDRKTHAAIERRLCWADII